MALTTAPLATAFAAGSDTPSPPPASDGKSTKDKKKSEKSSLREDPAFIKNYRTAYATIYDSHDYAAAIDQLKALGADDRADVANLNRYSYHKHGN
eukprot:gene40945-55340_t